MAPRRTTFGFVLLYCLGAIAGSAEADVGTPEPVPPSPTPVGPPYSVPPEVTLEKPPEHAVYALLGAGAPLGFFGVEGVQRLGQLFEVSGGVGIGLSAAKSNTKVPVASTLQWGIMPRVRRTLVNDRHSLTFGVGVSGGKYGGLAFIPCADEGCTAPQSYPTRYVFWGNIELGGEHWLRTGFAVRWFVGFARACAIDTCFGIRNDAIPYAGAGLGYAF